MKPAAWHDRDVEVLVGQGCGRGWWYFEGELEQRNAAAFHTGGRPLYRPTDEYLEHPEHENVAGRVWVEVKS